MGEQGVHGDLLIIRGSITTLDIPATNPTPQSLPEHHQRRVSQLRRLDLEFLPSPPGVFSPFAPDRAHNLPVNFFGGFIKR